MSSGIKGIEPVIAAMQARLSADLPAEILVANDDADDGLVLDVPVHVLDYIPAVGELRDFPTVGLLHGAGTFEDDSAVSATGVYSIGIVTFVQQAEPDLLARALRRYTRSILRVALKNRAIQGGPWGMILQSVDYGPALADVPEGGGPPTRYIAWSTVQIQCRQDEE